MKYTKPAAAVAATLSLTTAPLHAGNLAEPLLEPEVISEEAAAASASASTGFVLPLFFLVILAAALSSSGGGIEE